MTSKLQNTLAQKKIQNTLYSFRTSGSPVLSILDFLTALRTDKILYVFLNSKKIMYNIVLHYLKNIK